MYLPTLNCIHILEKESFFCLGLQAEFKNMLLNKRTFVYDIRILVVYSQKYSFNHIEDVCYTF